MISLQELKRKQANFCINKKMELNTFSQFSHSVMADSFQPHGHELQQPVFPDHHRLPELAQTYVH